MDEKASAAERHHCLVSNANKYNGVEISQVLNNNDIHVC